MTAQGLLDSLQRLTPAQRAALDVRGSDGAVITAVTVATEKQLVDLTVDNPPPQVTTRYVLIT